MIVEFIHQNTYRKNIQYVNLFQLALRTSLVSLLGEKERRRTMVLVSRCIWAIILEGGPIY